MGGRLALVLFLGLALLHLPTVSADDTESSAATLTDGVSSTGYVCDPDGCSPTDKRDFWKIQGKKGDIVQVSFSGSMSNPCFFGFGAMAGKGTFTMGSVSQNVDDNSPLPPLSTTLSTAGEIILKVKERIRTATTDLITPSRHPSTRPTVTRMKTDSSTPKTIAPSWLVTSTNDRKGCTDSDGDGWSDPDNGWGVQNGADAFPSESSQWLDSDNDGYGDNFEGFQGDHCQFSRGYSSSGPIRLFGFRRRFVFRPRPGRSERLTKRGSLTLWVRGMRSPTRHRSGTTPTRTATVTTGTIPHRTPRVLWDIGVFVDNASSPMHAPSFGGRRFRTDLVAWTQTLIPIPTAMKTGPLRTVPTPSLWNQRSGWTPIETAGATTRPSALNGSMIFRSTQPSGETRTDDGWGDNQTYGATQVDDFPFVPSQHRDSDGDGYGDNLTGFEGDVCVQSTPEEVDSGWISRYDRLGCRDVDRGRLLRPNRPVDCASRRVCRRLPRRRFPVV